MTRQSFPTIPDRVGALGISPFGGSKEANAISMLLNFIEDHVIPVLRNGIDGKLNNVTDVTLTASSTTTTITDPRIGPDSHLSFTPTTATAATAAGGLYVSARDTGTATVTHASTADTDKTFTLAIVG